MTAYAGLAQAAL